MGAAHWSTPYIGRVYRAGVFDCLHLVELVQREVFGRAVDLPKDRPGGTSARVMGEQIREHLPRFARVVHSDAAAEGDLVLMIGAGYLDHIGVLVLQGGERWVLHNFIRARQVVLHRLRDLGQWGLTVEGVYQWN